MDQTIFFIVDIHREKDPPIRLIRDINGLNKTNKNQLFKNTPLGYRFEGIFFTDDLIEADFLLVPQPIRDFDVKTKKYVENIKREAKKIGKKVVVFVGKDDSHNVHIDDVFLFVRSSYKHTIRKNEIQVVPLVEDLAQQEGFVLRTKDSNQKPTITFCGYASFPSFLTYVKYLIKNVFLDVVALLVSRPNIKAYKRGIFFRRKAIKLLERDARFNSQFIIRRSYFGDKRTISKNPNDARAEYITSMQHTDFVLTPKGDGNYSDRFFEALSLGRIPVLIDTDCVLPLENLINYEKFVVRVPHTDLGRIGDYVYSFWESLDDKRYQELQRAARDAFETYLRYDRFYSKAFKSLKKEGIESPFFSK